MHAQLESKFHLHLQLMNKADSKIYNRKCCNLQIRHNDTIDYASSNSQHISNPEREYAISNYPKNISPCLIVQKSVLTTQYHNNNRQVVFSSIMVVLSISKIMCHAYRSKLFFLSSSHPLFIPKTTLTIIYQHCSTQMR